MMYVHMFYIITYNYYVKCLYNYLSIIIINYKFYSRSNFRNPSLFFEKRKSLLIAPAMRIHIFLQFAIGTCVKCRRIPGAKSCKRERIDGGKLQSVIRAVISFRETK